MKKKSIIITAVVIIAIAAIDIAYVSLGAELVEVQTHSYLLDNGYTNADISTIDVKHSFVNLILSYDEWTSIVVFMDDPAIQYHFTWEDNAISSTGVSGEISDKNDVKSFS